MSEGRTCPRGSDLIYGVRESDMSGGRSDLDLGGPVYPKKRRLIVQKIVFFSIIGIQYFLQLFVFKCGFRHRIDESQDIIKKKTEVVVHTVKTIFSHLFHSKLNKSIPPTNNQVDHDSQVVVNVLHI